MKTSVITLLLAAVLLFAGCSNKIRWIEERELVNDSARQAAAQHAEKILGATPTTLSGHDQDWDDAIAEAEKQARNLFARRMLREWEVRWDGFPVRPTGRVQYLDAPPAP